MAEQVIDIDKVGLIAEDDPFWALRGKAIQYHAALERSLCNLMAILGEMPSPVAYIIFFKITSTRARDKALEKLLKRKYAKAYAPFWKSIEPILSRLSETRNKIVHWSVAYQVSDPAKPPEVVLLQQDHMDPTSQELLTVHDLGQFRGECSILSRLLNMFCVYLTPMARVHMPAEQVQAWHDIFERPLTYPLPSDHPLFLTPKAPERPPAPSPPSPPHL